MTGPHDDDVREGLREAASRRAEARRAEQEAIVDLADWMIRAQASTLPMGEAAEIVGLSRKAAYDLIAWRTGRRANRR